MIKYFMILLVGYFWGQVYSIHPAVRVFTPSRVEFTAFNNYLRVEQDTAADQFVYQFIAADINNPIIPVQYYVADNEDFYISSSNGSVYTRRTISHPVGFTRKLKIGVHSPIGDTEDEFTIKIIPAKSPKFSSNHFEITMNRKSLNQGREIIKAQVKNKYQRGDLLYGLHMNEPQMFKIDELTGVVTLNVIPDSEITEIHAVIVAYYGETPKDIRQPSSATLVVKLINNDDDVYQIANNETQTTKYEPDVTTCKMEQQQLNEMKISWPETKVGETAISRCKINDEDEDEALKPKYKSEVEKTTYPASFSKDDSYYNISEHRMMVRFTTTTDRASSSNNDRYYNIPEHPMMVRDGKLTTTTTEAPMTSTNPTTRDMNEVDPNEMCKIIRSKMYAERACIMNRNNIPEWAPISTTACTTEVMNERIVARELISLMETSKLIKYYKNDSCTSINAFAETVEKLRRAEKFVPESTMVLKNITMIISNLMDIDASAWKSVDKDGLLRMEIINNVNNMLKTLPATPTESIKLNTKNILLSAQIIDLNNLETNNVKVYLDYPDDGKQCSILHHPLYRNKIPKLSPSTQECSSLVIPKSVLEKLDTGDGMIRIQYATLANNKLFNCGKYDLVNECDDNVPVVMVTVGKIALNDLKDPIEIEIPTYNLKFDKGNYVCSSWDEKEKYWSTDGLETEHKNNISLCYSKHLSAFTLYYDPLRSVNSSSTTSSSLMYFVILFFSWSLLTILFFALLHRKLRVKYSNKILIHLLLSLMMVYCNMFAEELITLLHPRYVRSACYIISLTSRISLLQYAIWTFIQALYLNRIFYLQEITRSEELPNKVVLLAYGLPALIVGGNMIMIEQNDNGKRCLMLAWNTYTYYSLYYIPMTLIIVINVILFFKIMYGIFRLQRESLSLSRNRTNPKFYIKVLGFITTFSLLGITWIQGPLARFIEIKIWLDEICSYINAAQGIIIFSVKFIYQKDVRQLWYATISQHILRSRNFNTKSNAPRNQPTPQIAIIAAATTSSELVVTTV